jgi:hypothetical protein
LLVKEAYQIGKGWLSLREHVVPDPLSDTMQQLKRQWLNFQADFNVSEESHIFVDISASSTPNLDSIF